MSNMTNYNANDVAPWAFSPVVRAVASCAGLVVTVDAWPASMMDGIVIHVRSFLCDVDSALLRNRRRLASPVAGYGHDGGWGDYALMPRNLAPEHG